MLWWSTLNCASSSLPSARAEPGRLIVPVKEKELRIKRPLIGVKVAKLPFLTSARDKALESPALWRGKGISQLCIPLSPSQMESSQGVFLATQHPWNIRSLYPHSCLVDSGSFGPHSSLGIAFSGVPNPSKPCSQDTAAASCGRYHTPGEKGQLLSLGFVICKCVCVIMYDCVHTRVPVSTGCAHRHMCILMSEVL